MLDMASAPATPYYWRVIIRHFRLGQGEVCQPPSPSAVAVVSAYKHGWVA